jgi:phosphate transport system ATP-binding protein
MTMASASNVILEVQNLNAWFGKIHAVRNINLWSEKNTVTALIGPSGCGKSTFIRCLNRLHEETPGASVQGQVIVSDRIRSQSEGKWEWSFKSQTHFLG